MKTAPRQQKVSPIILAAMLLALPLCTYAQDAFTFEVRSTKVDVPCAFSDKKECAQMEVDLLSSGNVWADRLVNAKVSGYSAGLAEGLDKRAQQLSLENAESIRQGGHPSEYHVTIADLGARGNVRQVQVTHYTYIERGEALITNVIFDPVQQRVLELNDFVILGKMDELKSLVREQCALNAKRLMGDDPSAVAVYIDAGNFFMTDNVRFTDKGLAFDYQVYDIASRADGPQTLVVPYAELEGIIVQGFL